MYKIGNDPVANKKIKIHHFYSFRVHHISTRNRLYIITLSESFDLGNEQFGTVDAVSRLGVDQRHAILGGKRQGDTSKCRRGDKGGQVQEHSHFVRGGYIGICRDT